MDFSQQLGKRIRRARMDNGMTQGELASEAHVGANYVPRLERGELVPSVETAFRIARALGLSLDELCGRPVLRADGQDVHEAMGRLERVDAAVLRRVADVVEVLIPPVRRVPRVIVKKSK